MWKFVDKYFFYWTHCYLIHGFICFNLIHSVRYLPRFFLTGEVVISLCSCTSTCSAALCQNLCHVPVHFSLQHHMFNGSKKNRSSQNQIRPCFLSLSKAHNTVYQRYKKPSIHLSFQGKFTVLNQRKKHSYEMIYQHDGENPAVFTTIIAE